MAGGQQFFSNYLRAFKDTVDKLTELVNLTEQIVPKYSILSDNIQSQKEYGIGAASWDIGNYPQSIQTQLSGFIRVKMTCYNSGTYSLVVYIKKNGVEVYQANINSKQTIEKITDLEVKEGDVLVISGEDLKMQTLKICYDLVSKPNISIQ